MVAKTSGVAVVLSAYVAGEAAVPTVAKVPVAGGQTRSRCWRASEEGAQCQENNIEKLSEDIVQAMWGFCVECTEVDSGTSMSRKRRKKVNPVRNASSKNLIRCNLAYRRIWKEIELQSGRRGRYHGVETRRAQLAAS